MVYGTRVRNDSNIGINDADHGGDHFSEITFGPATPQDLIVAPDGAVINDVEIENLHTALPTPSPTP